MGLGPSDDYKKARGSLDDVRVTGVAGLVKQVRGWRSQIALAKHAKPAKSESHPHGRPQVPQRRGELTKRGKKRRKYREAMKRGGAHTEVGGPEERRDLERIQGRRSQSQFLVEEPDPGQVVTDAPGRLEMKSEVSDVTSQGRNGGVDERERVMVTESNES